MGACMIRSMLVVGSLLLMSLAFAPSAQADELSTCEFFQFPDETDQTGTLACRTLDWALTSGPSPVQTVPDYVECYIYEQPIGSWVPDCS